MSVVFYRNDFICRLYITSQR